MNKIKVVVIDDSPLIRTLLTDIIEAQPDMEVVALAADTASAFGLVQAQRPDVVTLDVEMPRMDGLGFIDKLMHQAPTAILMISTLTARGPQTTLRALELGAVDYLFKPRKDIQNGMKACAEEIVAKLRIAARAHLRPLAGAAAVTRENRPRRVLPALQDSSASSERILVFGASTGGTEALKEVLIQLPADCPAIVIAQHMPEGFTRSFAARLDGLCRLSVKEAEAGERILPGHVYLAPGHSHLLLARCSGGYACELSQAAPVNRHRPSVDVLFRSAALQAGMHAIGVILTGMGKDGALGLKEMHDAGAYTFAQDEASCVVFGMPREAIAEGAVDEVVPLEELPGRILAHLASPASRNRH